MAVYDRLEGNVTVIRENSTSNHESNLIAAFATWHS